MLNLKILLLFCILPTTLFCFGLENNRIVNLEIYEHLNYDELKSNYNIGLSNFFAYSKNASLFFAAFQRKDIKSSYQKISSSNINNVQSLEVYGSIGKYLYTVGEVNTYRNGGIINIASVQIENDTIFIYDSSTDRVNAFKFSDSGSSFLYSINLNKNQASYSFHISNNRFYGSKPKDFLISDDNTAFVADIIQDKNYPQSKELVNIRTFFSCEDYRNAIDFYNNPIFKKLVDKRISGKESDKRKDIIYECIFTGGIYITPLYVFNSDSTFYAINIFGTELVKFDILCNPIDTIKIHEFEAFRNQELDLYQRIKRKDVSYTNSFCKLDNVFLDSKDSLIFLYYRLTTTMSDIKNGNKFLFVYSILENAFIVNFYPIDFIPITFDENISKLVGFNFIGDEPCIEYYDIVW